MLPQPQGSKANHDRARNNFVMTSEFVYNTMYHNYMHTSNTSSTCIASAVPFRSCAMAVLNAVAVPNLFVWRAALFASLGAVLTGYYDG